MSVLSALSRPPSKGSLALATAILASAFATVAEAQNVYRWTATGTNNWGSNNWDSAAPYSGNPGAGGVDIIIDASTLDLTAARTLNLNSATSSVARTTGTIRFGDIAPTGTTFNNWTLGDNSTTVTPLTFAVSTGTGVVDIKNGTTTFAVPIAGTQGLTKIGTGNLSLTNTANSLTGGLFLNAGELTFGSGTLGNNNITVGGNASLTWSGAGNVVDLSSRITLGDGFILTLGVSGVAADNTVFASALQTGPAGTGSITKANAGTLTFSAAQTYTGGTRVNNGRLILNGGDNRLSAAGSLSFGNGGNAGVVQLGDANGASNQTVTNLAIVGTAGDRNAVVGGAATNSIFTINNATNIVADSAPTIGGAGVNENNLALVKTGLGGISLAKASTFAGNVDIQGGRVTVSNANALGTTAKTVSIIGTTDAPSLQISSPTGIALPAALSLRTSNDDSTTPALVNTLGNNIVQGNIALASGGFAGGHTRVFLNQGSLALLGNIAPAADVTSDRNLILDGIEETNGRASGILSDTGTHKLNVIKDGVGTWTLTGANSFSGSVQINAGRLNLNTAQINTGAINAGASTTLGVTLAATGQTLQAASLALGSVTGATLAFDLATFNNPAAPVIQTGSLSIQIGSQITVAGTGLSIGEFPLLQYGGTIGGEGLNGLPSGNLPSTSVPSRVTANLVHNTTLRQIRLNVSKFDVPKWTGQNGNVWTINESANPLEGTAPINWKEATSGTPTRYRQSGGAVDSVIFDDSAIGSTDISLVDALAPTSITVNTSSLSYTLSGSGKLTGATTLLKQGSTTLTLANTGANDFTGTTTIQAGTVQVGDGMTVGGGQLGSGPVINQGLLKLNRPDDFIVANALSGSGSVEKIGSNVTTLSGGSGTFTGPIRVSSGFLKVGNVAALGSIDGATTVDSGAELQITGFAISEPVNLNGGTLSSLSGTVSRLNGPLALSAGAKAAVLAGTLTLGGSITGTGGLTKTDTGNLTLAGTSSFEGGLTVDAGTVIVSSDQAYTGPTTVKQGTLQIGTTSATGKVGTGDIILSPASGTATLSIQRNDSALVIANNITSSGDGTNSVSIGATGANSASGTVTFSGNNSFTGNVTINGGTLRITNSNALGSGTKTVSAAQNSRPSLQLDGSAGNITLAPEITITASSDGTQLNNANNAGAVVNLAGNNQLLGKLSLVNGGGGEGKVVVQGGTLTLAGGVNADGATGNRNLLIGGAGNGFITGAISDTIVSETVRRTVGVNKDGAGTWTLSGANDYTGGTVVTAGELVVNGSLSGTASIRIATGGTLRLGGSNLIKDAATFTLGGGTLQTGGFSEGDGASSGLGLFSLTASSVIDFGAGTGSSLLFAGLAVGGHSAGTQLSLVNWSGVEGVPGTSSNDRLLFSGTVDAFIAQYAQVDVLINGLPGYTAYQVDANHYEIGLATVPEPGSLPLMALPALLGLSRRFRRS